MNVEVVAKPIVAIKKSWSLSIPDTMTCEVISNINNL